MDFFRSVSVRKEFWLDLVSKRLYSVLMAKGPARRLEIDFPTLFMIAEWGAFHHERLDGSGYPFHCKAADLTIGARIMMVADIFTATAEDRPYRKGIIRILKDFSARKLLESKVVDLLVENYDEVFLEMRKKQEAARAFYEEQFACVETASV
ncbi:MAG: hypothetical protein AUK29_01640 [Nitrospirae bacterium CG2_30_53_67]|nr:MAG: hypothetical protein AUK29_01640 [Nitrospirae bacterium CG2_30_53_67]PIW86225.1 MAG: hypothetical protein COZ95_00430 [Nitrospirae bacterium CG_4_8_14_3_um_filter_50_41]